MNKIPNMTLRLQTYAISKWRTILCSAWMIWVSYTLIDTREWIYTNASSREINELSQNINGRIDGVRGRITDLEDKITAISKEICGAPYNDTLREIVEKIKKNQ